MKKMSMILAGILLIPIVTVAVGMTTPAGAALDFSGGLSSSRGAGSAEGVNDPGELVTKFVNLLLWLVGIISVVMLIFGGIKYATSAGDTNKVKLAKDTILYAVIGLVVSLLAYAIVNFVFNEIGKP